MFSDIFNNPEIIRNIRYRLRPKTIILTLVLTIASILFIAILVMGQYGPSMEKSMNLFRIYAWLSTSVGFLYGILLTQTSIIGERDKKTYDFLFMTPLSDRVIAIGKLLGSTVHMWLILFIMMFFLFFTGLGAWANGLKLVIFFLTLILGALASASLGLLISVSINKTASALVGFVIILIIYFSTLSFAIGIPGHLSYLRFYGLLNPASVILDIGNKYVKGTDNIISFFSSEINAGWMTIFLYAWLVFWMMRAVIRKIRNLHGAYLTQIEALIFFVVFEILLVGFQWEYIRDTYDFWQSLATYLLTNGIILLIISCGLTLNREEYFSYARGKSMNTPYRLLGKNAPAHLLFLILCLIMTAGLFVMLYVRPADIPISLLALQTGVLIATIGIFYLLVQLLKTVFIYSGPVVSIITLALFLTLPPVVVGVFDMREICYIYCSPIAYIYFLTGELSHPEFWFLPVLLGALLVIMLVVFIFRHNAIKKIVRHRLEI